MSYYFVVLNVVIGDNEFFYNAKDVAIFMIGKCLADYAILKVKQFSNVESGTPKLVNVFSNNVHEVAYACEQA